MILTCLELFKGFCLKRPKSFCSAGPSGLAPVFCLPSHCPCHLANTFAWTTLLPAHLRLVLQSLLQLSSPKIPFSTDSPFHHVSLLYCTTDRCELDMYLWFFYELVSPCSSIRFSCHLQGQVRCLAHRHSLYKYFIKRLLCHYYSTNIKRTHQAKCLNTTPWAPGFSFFLTTLPLNKTEPGLVNGTPTGSFRLEKTQALLSPSPLRRN